MATCGVGALRSLQERGIRRELMANAPLRVVEGGSMDKDKALAAALSQIERNFGKGSIMRLGEASSIEVESISTG
jgi:recombination protein RecA